MQKPLGKDSLEYQFMAEYWKFIQEWWHVEDTDEWWNAYYEARNALSKKYIHISDFADEHILAFCKIQTVMRVKEMFKQEDKKDV